MHPILNNRVSNAAKYNLTNLWEIAGQDKEFIKEIVVEFTADARESINSISQSIHLNDRKALAYYSHRIKPSLSMPGCFEVKEKIARLEELALMNCA